MIVRGREFTESDITHIKSIITDNGSASRRRLSLMICEQLNWRQTNGHLKDRACRDVLLRLDRQGIIKLPCSVYTLSTQHAGVKRLNFTEPSDEMSGAIHEFDPPVFQLVNNQNQRVLWNYLIDNYHYKKCCIVVGRHLKYLIYLNNRLIGCCCFADAVLKLIPRDQWIGWNHQQRQAHLPYIINNVRFLILPWVRIKNLASKLLGLMVKIVPAHWEQRYSIRPVLMETFIEQARFTGASYKAANWLCVGQTRGKGRSGMNYYYHGIIKDVYLYPLVDTHRLRQQLGVEGASHD
jgi:hypothetical protein